MYYAEIDLRGIVSPATLRQFQGEVSYRQLDERTRKRQMAKRREARQQSQIEKRKQAEEPVYEEFIPVEPLEASLPQEEDKTTEAPRGIWGSFKQVIAKEPVKGVRRNPKPKLSKEEGDDEEYRGTQITLGQMLGL